MSRMKPEVYAAAMIAAVDPERRDSGPDDNWLGSWQQKKEKQK
jgi:hypothetical protein